MLVGPDQPDDVQLLEYENMLSTAPDVTAQARVSQTFHFIQQEMRLSHVHP
jgi:hypothetical protein